MELFLKQMILTFATIFLLAGIAATVLQISWQAAFIIGATFFLMQKIVLFQEVIVAKWKIMQEIKNDSKD